MRQEPVSFGIQYMYGSHRGPDAPAYCRACGSPMKVTTKRIGFDRESGQVLTELRATCSRPVWLRTLEIWRFHDHAVQDFHGDWPWI